jgi:non-specific serine/threonine protein kinase
MLETIREYALEHMHAPPGDVVLGHDRGRRQAPGITDDVQERHRAYFLQLAETAEPHLRDREQHAWMDQLEREHDNLRAALAWSLETDATEAGLRLVAALWWFWWMRGYVREGRTWIEQILALPTAAPSTIVRAKALRAAGWLAFYQGDAAAVCLHEASLTISRTLAQPQLTAEALAGLAIAVHAQGDDRRAEALLLESLALHRDLSDPSGCAWVHSHLGWLAWTQRDVGRAGAWCRESVARFRATGDTGGMAWPLRTLGLVAAAQGDWPQALQCFADSLRLFWDLDARGGIAECLVHLAGAADVLGQPERAAQLLGAVEALGTARDLLRTRIAEAEYTATVAAIRGKIEPAVFAAAWVGGRNAPITQTIEQALSIGDTVAHDGILGSQLPPRESD